MIDNKLIGDVLKGIEHLRDGLEKIRLSNEKPKIEPQAGDVWDVGGVIVFVYEYNLWNEKQGLYYIFADGSGHDSPIAGMRIGNLLIKRIFSLSEYLKNKEAEDA